jgi:hypothetical protein
LLSINLGGQVISGSNLVLGLVDKLGFFNVWVPLWNTLEFFEEVPYLSEGSVNFDKKREQNHIYIFKDYALL